MDDSRNNHHIIHIVALIALALLVTSNNYRCSWHFDDNHLILENPGLRAPLLHPAAVLLPKFPDRPVLMLTFWLNYRLGRLNVFGYHLVNNLLHLLNGLLLYLFVFIAAGYTRPRPARIAFAAAALFLCSPVQTEAVTYIASRSSVLATFFCLLSMISFALFRRRNSGVPFYLSALLFLILALGSKEIAFILPFLLIAYDLLIVPHRERRNGVVYHPPFFLALVLPMLLKTYLFPNGWLPRPEISRETYLLTQFRVIVCYIRLLILPVGLNADHDFPLSVTFLRPSVLASFGLLAFLILSAIRVRPRHPLASFGILWFFIALSATSSLFPIEDVIFERRLYLPSCGFFIVASLALARLRALPEKQISARPADRRYAIILALVVIFFSAGTHGRNAVWENEYTLWADTVKKSPFKARPHSNLGVALMERPGYTVAENAGEAIEEFKIALSLDPESEETYNNLGNACKELGLKREAMEAYRRAISLNAYFTDAYSNLGVMYEAEGDREEALRLYGKALSLNPAHAATHNNLGNVYFKDGRWDEAIAEYRVALSMRPGSADVHNNLGSALFKKGLVEEAIRQYEAALRIRPDSPEIRKNYLIAVSSGRGVRAERAAGTEVVREKALLLRPELKIEH